jgi:hypothetical protein
LSLSAAMITTDGGQPQDPSHCGQPTRAFAVPQAMLDAEQKRYEARQTIKAKRAKRSADRAKRAALSGEPAGLATADKA